MGGDKITRFLGPESEEKNESRTTDLKKEGEF